MSTVEITLYVLIAAGGLSSFASFILLGTRFGSVRRLGACLMVFGIGIVLALGHYQYRLVLFGDRAEGVVEEVVARRKAYRPVVRFVSGDGQEVRFRCRQGVLQDTYAVGQSVPVYYLRSDPAFAVVASRPSLWQPLVIGTAVGLLPLVAGGVMIARRPTRPRL
jgi:hypothetical protein